MRIKVKAIWLYVALFVIGYIIFALTQVKSDEVSPANLIGLLSMFIFKPGMKLLLLYAVAKIDFVTVDFEKEISKNNIAAAITYLAIALVIATAF